MPYIGLLSPEGKCSAPASDVVADLPPNLDPARCPIIATHFYGWRPVGDVAAVIVSDLRSGFQAKHQYAERLA